MNLPNARKIYDVIDATWPAHSTTQLGPWTIRNGRDGGNRVSAATATKPAQNDDIAQAASAMRALGQPALFMIREGDDALDTALENTGYVIKDPVTLYAAPIAAIATQRPPPVTTFEVWPPLASQAEIWAEGGIGPGRLAVMERAAQPKTTLLSRDADTPAGTVFIGIALGCAMIHALEITPTFRRQGLAAHLTRAAAFWAQSQGADWLTLVTTRANPAANALYTSLGMSVVGQYHYRILPEDNHG